MTAQGAKGGTNKPHDRSTAGRTGEKPGAKSTATAKGTQGAEDGTANCGNSGLDRQGNFRIGERISLGVRGSDLVLTQSHSGREIVVSEAALAGLLDDTYFVDKVD